MSEKIRTATVRDIDQYLSEDTEVCAWEDVKNVLDAKNKALELAKVLVKMDAVTIQNKDNEIAELKAKLEDVQASAYAESVDAGMRERRLKRALYNACANWAKYKKWDAFTPDKDWKKWHEMSKKCRAKAEEYK